MTTYNTGNPVGSTDARDLYDNSQALDQLVNGSGTYANRLGVLRRTLAKLESDFDAQLADAESDLNVYRAEAAESASQALGYLNVIRTTSYGAYAEDPATDPLGNPPTVGDEYFNTTANLLKRWNGTTWQASDINTANLSAPSGSSLVGYDTGTVQDVLDNAKPMQSYTALRAYTGRATGVRITQQGIAGFFQRLASGDPEYSAADDGGVIIVDASGRRWKRLFTGEVSVKWFGAKGDWNGSTGSDDTVAVASALNSGYRRIDFHDGTYKITSKISVASSSVEIHGNAKFVIAVNDDHGFSVSGKTRFEVYGIYFDGNHTAKGAIACSDVQFVKTDECTFYDFRTDTYVYPMVLSNIADCRISDCRFEKLWAVKGTVPNGVVTALYATGYHKNTRIENCSFYDINNVTSLDVLDWQDADALHFYVNPATSPQPVQNIVVRDCYFENVGKRAVKFNAQSNSNLTFTDSVVVSSWTSVDAAAPQGMYAVVSPYGGSCTISNVKLRQGACRYFLDSQVAAIKLLNVTDCVFTPELHTTVGGDLVQGVLMSPVLADARTFVENCDFDNCNTFIYYAPNLTAIGNKAKTTGGTSISVGKGRAVVCGNTIESSTQTGQGIYSPANNLSSFIVSDNHITGFQDSIYLLTQEAASYGSINDNVLVNYARYPAVYTEGPSVRASNNHFNGVPQREDLSIVDVTAANIASATHAINTINKRKSKIVYDTTNNRIMIASGALATSAWYVADGSLSVTPV